MTLREAIINGLGEKWTNLDDEKRESVIVELDETEKVIETLPIEKRMKVSLKERILETVRRIC